MALLNALQAVDAQLDVPVEVILVGGAAAALHYGSRHATHDLDLYESRSRVFWDAADRARRADPSLPPIEHVDVGDAPYHYDERLETLVVPLKLLTVRVPERHDLAVMKTLRANAHDLATIEDIHTRQPLDLDVLIDRFRETSHAIGDPTTRVDRFLTLVARLWGDEVADELEASGRLG